MRHRSSGPSVPAREAPKVKIGIAAVQQMIVFVPDDDGVVHAVEYGFEHPNRDGIARSPFIDPCYVADFHNDIPVIENEMALFFLWEEFARNLPPRNLGRNFQAKTPMFPRGRLGGGNKPFSFSLLKAGDRSGKCGAEGRPCLQAASRRGMRGAESQIEKHAFQARIHGPRTLQAQGRPITRWRF